MSTTKLLVVLLILSAFVSSIFVLKAHASSEDLAASAINQAEEALASAYEAVLETEKAGADVSSLLVQLNDAGENLAEAHMSYRLGDFDGAVHSADLSSEIGEEVRSEAYELKNKAYGSRVTDLLVRVIGSTLGVIAVFFASFIGWHVFKRRYYRRNSKRNPKGLEADLGGYRTIFVAVSLVLVLVASAPALSLISIPMGGEEFSELWLLGPERRAENYPFNIHVNETAGPIYVGVRNHMGSSKYYVVYVKLRNQTQPLPDTSTIKPSSVPPLYEFRFFLANDEAWEAPVSFTIRGTSFQNASIIVHYASINSVNFSVNSSSKWDSERNGFYYQLFFELWLYNMTSQSFQYHNRFVGIWLNVTGS